LDRPTEKEEKRNAGLILIGGKHIESVFYAQSTGEERKVDEGEEQGGAEAEEQTNRQGREEV